MFDSDEITSMVILITDGSEIFAYKGELVESNLVNITSGPIGPVQRHLSVNQVLDYGIIRQNDGASTRTEVKKSCSTPQTEARRLAQSKEANRTGKDHSSIPKRGNKI